MWSASWRRIELRVFVIILFAALAQSSARAQRLEFSGQLGASGLDESRGVAVDLSGNIYLTGATDGALDGSNQGGHDAWLAKYDSSGGLRWIKQLGSRGDDFSYGVAVDSGGNVYTTGSTSDQLGTSRKGALDAWLAKYDSSGNLLWVGQFGTASDDISYGVAVDAADNVYLTGTTFDQLGATHFGDGDAFLAKYNGQGAPLWIDQLGTRRLDSARALAISPLGDIYITGDTADALGGNFEGGTDAFLARYDSSGTRQWVKQLGNTGIDECYGVAADANNIYITGRTDGFLGSSNQGGFDAWVAAYGVNGMRSWTRQLGTAADDAARGAAVDSAGNVYLTGWTAGSLGGANQGGRDAWVAQYQSNSNPRWTLQLGTSSADEALAITVDSARNYYLTGTSEGSLGGRYQGGIDAWFETFSQAPSISSFNPSNGATGNTITILGKNFSGTMSVRFNGASATFVINTPGQITATLPAAASTGRITVTNSYGTATSANDFTVTTIPAVTLSSTPTSRTIGVGQSTTYTINLNRTNYPGLVDLSVSGLPTGATYSFSADPTTGSSSSLRIDTTLTTSTGTRTLTISATATGITIAPITVTLTITSQPGVTLTATPSSKTITAGQSSTFTINLNRTSYSNTVSLSVSGLPAGATYNFNPHPVQGQVSNLNINTLTSTPTGTSTLTISATATAISITPITVTLTILPCCVDWVRQEGTSDSEYATEVAVDGAGNLYVVGGEAILLTKYGSTGQKIWEVPTLGGGYSPQDVTVDSAGNAYITGEQWQRESWLAKYDPDGNQLWIALLADQGKDSSLSVAVDGADVYITGRTDGSLGGTNPLPPNLDAWLARFDSSGKEIWRAQLGDAGHDDAWAIAARSGFVYVTGHTDGDLRGTGTGSLYLAKYETVPGPNGPIASRLWVHQFGSAISLDGVRDVAVLSSGDIYVTGSAGDETGATGDNAFLAKFDANGNEVWTRRLAAVAMNSSYPVARSTAIALDSADNAYITGYTTGSLGGTHQGEEDAFVAKYDRNGNLIWTKQLGSINGDISYGIAVNGSGGVFITGETGGSLGAIYQGPGSQSSRGDSWLAKLSPAVIPYITSFSPTVGPVGTSVIITGGNFMGATAVKFNGVSAAFTVNSATQITATVPAGVTTGRISVQTPCGFAYSAMDFVR